MIERVKPSKNIPVAGEKFGKLTVIQRVHDKKTKTANLKVQVRVECDCGNRLTVPYFYLIRTHIPPKSSCGQCGDKSFISEHLLTHRSWYMMNYRCSKPTHIAYDKYGGRGIRVHPSWSWDLPDLEGFKNFVRDMGDRPNQNLTLDRIDNNGHYEPGNCRWATGVEQRENQGHADVIAPNW